MVERLLVSVLYGVSWIWYLYLLKSVIKKTKREMIGKVLNLIIVKRLVRI